MNVPAHIKLDWIDSGFEPKCPSDPKYPRGIDLDISRGAQKTCVIPLPYPARRCGYHEIQCSRCGLVIAVSTAGRSDDPRSVRLPCRK